MKNHFFVRLLVTGGLGFIGSNFILKTLKKYPEHHITNIDACLDGSNIQSLNISNNSNYEFVKGNITDFNLMKKLIDKSDTIINFAAESHVDRSIYDAKPFFDSNILGVFTILEILKKQKKKLIQISTDEVFGNLPNGSATEISRFNPSSPYSSSKASAELLVNSYVITYGIDAMITRCTNNYGPHQFIEKLIPKTIIMASQDKSIPIYNNGRGIRDWMHVDDHVDAILKVLHKGQIGESYNISANNEFDVFQIVKKILSYMGKSEDAYHIAEDRPGHDDRYSLDSSKISNDLNWKPKINFVEGIEQTVDWYLKNKKWWLNYDKNILENVQWK